jgi:Na+-transporting NADH:ubiquinone oxidoreductase subunit F
MREMFYDEDFRQIREKFPNFSYNVALSDPLPEDNWEGHTGFIHQILYDNYLENHDDPTEIEYYMCGPPMMIEAAENMLYNLGVEPEMVAFDKF